MIYDISLKDKEKLMNIAFDLGWHTSMGHWWHDDFSSTQGVWTWEMLEAALRDHLVTYKLDQLA